MKVPPRKPHFFKPVQPGFKHGLKLPIGFLKYLKGRENEHAVLRRVGKKWLVKLNGHRFKEGWEKFVEENDLELGNILVFKHEGDMEFEVTIFDSSHCERECELPQQGVDEREEEKEKPESYTKTSVEAFFKAGVTKGMHLSNPHFICTIRPYCLSTNFMSIPIQFARENRLRNKRCTITTTDERRPWTFSLFTNGGHTYFGRGWREFCSTNCLKEGDRLMFEMVSNVESPAFRFYDLRRNETEKPESKIKTSVKAFSKLGATKDKHLSHPHFICIIRPYCLSTTFLVIPKQFARKNKLNNRKCTISMRDEQRSWTFSLYTSGQNTYFGRGWREFCVANRVKEGDRLMFEIVSNGETPGFHFYDLRGNAPLQPRRKKTNLDVQSVSTQGLDQSLCAVFGMRKNLKGNAPLQPRRKKTNLDVQSVSTQGLDQSLGAVFGMKKGNGFDTSKRTAPKAQVSVSTSPSTNPHFISTIQPYSIDYNCLYLPLAFAKTNGLFNRRCEMVLIDEKWKSWSVQLGPMSHHTGINRGWKQFKEANDVQLGDTFKFELINNGELPVVYFHCKYVGKDSPGIREALDKLMEQLMGNGKEPRRM